MVMYESGDKAPHALDLITSGRGKLQLHSSRLITGKEPLVVPGTEPQILVRPSP
jgi:hypothetical protein